MKREPDTIQVDDFGFAGFLGTVTWETLKDEDCAQVLQAIAHNLLRFMHLTAGQDQPTSINMVGHDGASKWPEKYGWTWVRPLGLNKNGAMEFMIDPDGIGVEIMESLQHADRDPDCYMVLVLIHIMTAIRGYLFEQGKISSVLTVDDSERYVDRADTVEFERHLVSIQNNGADPDIPQIIDGITFLYGIDLRLALDPSFTSKPYALAQLILREPNTPVAV